MLIRVDPHSGVPVFRQIVEQIEFEIAAGLLPPGEELPSTRALSAELRINPMTVSKAYGLLERDGALVRRPGQTLVVAPREQPRARRARLEHLRASLVPAARAARQLGLGPEEALEVFRELLGSAPGEEE